MVDYKKVFQSYLLAVLMVMVFVSPAFAQGPTNDNSSILDRVTDALSPVVEALGSFTDLLDGGYEASAEQMFGVNWNTSELTVQAYTPLTPTVDYYPDESIPDEVRQIGYSLEALGDVDTSTMSPLDYASYLGAVVALPFLYIRGLKEIADFVGPFGLFITWLLVAAAWVTFVHFLSWLLSVASTIFSVASRIFEIIGLVKP